jgi:hypothetical protein
MRTGQNRNRSWPRFLGLQASRSSCATMGDQRVRCILRSSGFLGRSPQNGAAKQRLHLGVSRPIDPEYNRPFPNGRSSKGWIGCYFMASPGQPIPRKSRREPPPRLRSGCSHRHLSAYRRSPRNQPTHSSEGAPALTCTSVPPTKSRTSKAASLLVEFMKPSGPHTQCATRRVDEDGPQFDEPQHCRELHTLGEGTGNQCRSDDRERHLEADVDGLGGRGLIPSTAAVGGSAGA